MQAAKILILHMLVRGNCCCQRAANIVTDAPPACLEVQVLPGGAILHAGVKHPERDRLLQPFL